MIRTFSEREIKNKLNNMKDWEYSDNVISKSFNFNTYMDSIKFISQLADLAEAKNHHPDMTVGWCKITISYSTHDAGGLTILDFEMAESTDELFNN